MNDILPFLLNHWALSAAFLLLLIAVVVIELRGKVGGAHKVSNTQAVHLMNREEGVVLDTRDRNSFTKGHIAGSMHILPSDIDSKHKKLEKHKTHPIIVVCSNGAQSGGIAAKLHKQGFEKMHYLAGGMNSWKADNLPTKKAKK